MEKSEEGRTWPTAAKNLQALLAPAHAGQPIMDQHDAPISIRIHALESSK